uniref:Uncharacterized protein n=1 Tax=Oryza rufipogon TaxID=4529 RepID=A0A0E0PDJ6_ORYRU
MDSTSTSPRGLPLITSTRAAKQSNRATLIGIVNCGAPNHPVQDHPSLTQRHQNVFQMHWLAVTAADSEDLLFLVEMHWLAVTADFEDLLFLVEDEGCAAGVGHARRCLVELEGDLLRVVQRHAVGVAAGRPGARCVRVHAALGCAASPVATSLLRSEKKNGVSVKFVGPIPVLPTAGRPLRS